MTVESDANSTSLPLVVGISSRALFDLDSCHRIFEEEGVEAYRRHQVEREREPLDPGVGFTLVQKLLRLDSEAPGKSLVEVVLISRNSADTGLRIFHSIEHHNLPITRAAFCGGGSAHRYVHAFGVHLFLSAASEDVEGALALGVPAAVLLPSAARSADGNADNATQVRIAFDGDAVLFDPQAEHIFRNEGTEAFIASEKLHASDPLDEGPFLPFAHALQALQAQFDPNHSPIRTALVTARSAPAHERAIRTLRQWGVRLDEALFLGGAAKGEFLSAFEADIFFDDKAENCSQAAAHTAAGHVPELVEIASSRKRNKSR